jgi:hypothetical protein
VWRERERERERERDIQKKDNKFKETKEIFNQ